MEQITSRNNSKVKEAYSIKNNKSSPFFIVEGFHCTEMAYRNSLLECVFTEKDVNFKGVQIYKVTKEIINKLSSTKSPEGIVGVCKKLESKDLNSNKIIYLDNVQDPSNVGAILRSALAFGYKDIILSPSCASIYNPKAILSSQGAIFSLNIVKGDIDLISKFKEEKQYVIISSCLKDSVSFDTFNLKENKAIIVFGNEGGGIRKEILSISDYKLRIDISNIDSLNVSVAAGIILNKFKD